MGCRRFPSDYKQLVTNSTIITGHLSPEGKKWDKHIWKTLGEGAATYVATLGFVVIPH